MQLFHSDPGRRVIVRAAPGVALSDCNSIISGLATTIIPPGSWFLAKPHNARRRIGDWRWQPASCRQPLPQKRRIHISSVVLLRLYLSTLRRPREPSACETPETSPPPSTRPSGKFPAVFVATKPDYFLRKESRIFPAL